MAASEYDENVSRHYASGDLGSAILDSLRNAGVNVDALTIDDLAPVDQLHTGGKHATAELLNLAELPRGIRILDVGGGLGGPARFLATELDATVTVLDLTQSYCDVGEMLTQRTGLSDRVSFQQGNALNIPFPDESFDAVWMQNAGMNIEDKEQLHREIFRVIRPGGRFATQEIVAGPVQPLHYPVVWAADASMNFLVPANTLRSLVVETGFTEVQWVDVTDSTQAWSNQQLKKTTEPDSLPPLGAHVIFGTDLRQKTLSAAARNQAENRMAIIRAVMERPS